MSAHSPNQSEHPAPHYRLPTDYLFIPQVDFWEIVCYRADVADGPFKLRQRDMMGLMTHPTFARARREALSGPRAPLIAIEEDAERYFILRAQAENWPNETLRKLRAYVERGWIVQLGHHRHATWVLNYLLLERQRRVERAKLSQKTPPETVKYFSLTWMQIKEALQTIKGRKVEYRKLKDGFLLLERLGFVTSLTDQPTAKLNYGQQFKCHLNVPRLLEVAPRFVRLCQQLEGKPLTLIQVVAYVLYTLIKDHQRPKKTQPWPLERLHGEVEVELEIEHQGRVAVQRELAWTAVGVLARAGILQHQRNGYALSPQAEERISDLTDLEAWTFAALAQTLAGQPEQPALSSMEVAKLDKLLAPCRQRDPGRADLARTIALQMNYPPETAIPLFALLRRRMDRISEEQFPALLSHFARRRAREVFSLNPADILDDFVPRRQRDRRKQKLTARKTLKGRRTVVEGQLDLQTVPQQIERARLYCTLRHGRPLPPELTEKPLDISLCSGDRELYHTTVPLLNIPDDPLAPADITEPLRRLTGNPTLTLRLTLPARLPALRMLARIETDVVKRET